MKRHINAEKLKAEIKRLKAIEYGDNTLGNDIANSALDYVLEEIIPSLQHTSIPSNLDEAAKEYEDWVESYSQSDFPTCISFRDAFKAGAEWMAGQGETQEHFVIGSIAGSPVGPAVVCYTKEFVIGDEVIVQIRKKQ